MSNWQAGMKAVCIGGGWLLWNNYTTLQKLWYIATGRRPRASGPKAGDVLTVRRVIDSDIGLALMFHETGAGDAFAANCFRPLDPLTAQLDRIESDGCPEPEPQYA